MKKSIDEQLMHGETPAVGPEFLHGANPAEAQGNKVSDFLVSTHTARTHGGDWPVHNVGEHVTAGVTPEMFRYMDQALAQIGHVIRVRAWADVYFDGIPVCVYTVTGWSAVRTSSYGAVLPDGRPGSSPPAANCATQASMTSRTGSYIA